MPDKRLNNDNLGVVSQTGETRDGQPLSLNRAPASDLSPWLARVHATKAAVPDGREIHCGMFADTAVLRILLDGDWYADTASGKKKYTSGGLFFGAQSRRMPVGVTGNFATAAVALMPGTCHALAGPKMADCLNQVLDFSEAGFDAPLPHSLFQEDAAPEDWISALEDAIRMMIEQRGGAKPNPITVAFDTAAFADPNMKVSDFAKDNGIEARQLERVIKRDFGMAPKQVLRRARTLDMAAHLRGVADSEEAEEIALRYFDQSHLNRDFAALLGMTPLQFVQRPQPLMTLALEYRQARRVEALKRVSPDAIKPWQAP